MHKSDNPKKSAVDVIDKPFANYLSRYKKESIESNPNKMDEILNRLDRIEKGIRELSGLQLMNGVWR